MPNFYLSKYAKAIITSLWLNTPITPGVPLQKLFPHHIPTDGTKIIVEIGDDNIYFPLGIDTIIFKCLGNHFQNDTLFLTLGRNGLQPAIFKKSINHFLTIFNVPLGLNFSLVRLLLQYLLLLLLSPRCFFLQTLRNGGISVILRRII